MQQANTAIATNPKGTQRWHTNCLPHWRKKHALHCQLARQPDT